MSRKERILYALKQVGIDNINQLGEDHGGKMYAKLYRQLFSQQDYGVTLEVVEYIIDRFPQISAYFIINGEGPWERTKIVTPPTHRQDIHIDSGATAAISQTGTASVDATDAPTDKEVAPDKELFSPADIAKWVSEQNVGALVGVILSQKDEIIRLKEQRIADLEQSVRIADSQLFKPIK